MNCWKRPQELEVADGSKDTVSSRPSRTDAQVNSGCGARGGTGSNREIPAQEEVGTNATSNGQAVHN